MNTADGTGQTADSGGLSWANAYIGLGANLNNPIATLRHVMDELAALPSTRCSNRSSLYRSAPVNASGPDFINAVVHLVTSLQPLALLHCLQRTEQTHGRTRPYANAPRTLDLDLILYDNVIMNTPDLVLPHPRMAQRAFVLLPLAELAPSLQVPGQGDLASLLPAVSDQAIERLPANATDAEPSA
jgi:2-amino-4-hydroxy-6-hydroxymethyldihydropteridine diphosphokinase